MCSICGMSIGHYPSCPDNVGVKIGVCEHCGEDIYEGDKVWVRGDKMYCCLKNIDRDELLDLLCELADFRRERVYG